MVNKTVIGFGKEKIQGIGLQKSGMAETLQPFNKTFIRQSS